MLIQLSVFLQAFVTFSVDKSEMPHVAHSPRPSQGPKARPLATRAFAANITVPLIDHYTQPRVYGHR